MPADEETMTTETKSLVERARLTEEEANRIPFHSVPAFMISEAYPKNIEVRSSSHSISVKELLDAQLAKALWAVVDEDLQNWQDAVDELSRLHDDAVPEKEKQFLVGVCQAHYGSAERRRDELEAAGMERPE